ncbi:MAG: toprim domain-containing protein [Fuscovulum sp.]|nr:MAG: toprim domain-containing protein [Fuscovulum sp.]
MWGTNKGGAIRLSEGGGRLVVAEGIETALSLLCGLLDGPFTLWAGGSTSGLRGLSLPPVPGSLIIGRDNGKPGGDAAFALAERATSLGWAVSILTPPDCYPDFNDMLTGKAVAA